MASPSNHSLDPHPPESVYQIILSKFQGDMAERVNVEQMFILIDGVLPFEACLYYQVLPLFLEGSRLHLGMVSPDDVTANDYVRRIISYHNYSIVPQQIDSDVLQTVLTAYLSQSEIKSAAQAEVNPKPQPHRNVKARHDEQQQPSLQKTLVVDSPEELSEASFSSSDAQTIPIAAADSTPFDFELAEQEENSFIPVEAQAKELDPTRKGSDAIAHPYSQPQHPPSASFDEETFLTTDTSQLAAKNASQPQTSPQPPENLLPTLEINAQHLASPIEVLTQLPPNVMLNELLARILYGGIGRLYFERQPYFGRVLWSQNGVLQSVIERVEAGQFQGLISELKRMVNLSLIPVQKPQQVEIERFYRHSRILLRFRFIPTEYGEGATLQVLRGAALKFYQQQQINKLERDAITIARQLQTKLDELYSRAHKEPGVTAAKLETLPALTQLLHSIEAQIDALQSDLNIDQDFAE